MKVLNLGSSGASLFLDSIHSEVRETCIAYLPKTFLLPFSFQVQKGILRLNCAEIVDPTPGAKHLMTHNTQNNNNNNICFRQSILLRIL